MEMETWLLRSRDHDGFPSWPGSAVRRTASLPLAHARPSTSFLAKATQDVDARHKAGMTSFAESAMFLID
jgi:hypothetical protein